METLSGSQIRTFQLKKYGMQRILLTKARIFGSKESQFIILEENFFFAYSFTRQSVKTSDFIFDIKYILYLFIKNITNILNICSNIFP